MAKRSSRKRILGITIALLLAIAAAGYAASKGYLGPTACSLLQTVFQAAQPPPPATGDPPQEPDDDPREEIPKDKIPLPSPPDKPVEIMDPQPLPEIIIYEGQSLVIPRTDNNEGKPSAVITKGTLASETKQIALTFDSGWLFDQTIPLLDVLDRYDVRATFFMRALWVEAHPDLAREIVKRGHTVGNHSLEHKDMTEFTADQIQLEMRRSTEIIENITGVRPYLFRPPYGEYNGLMLDVLGGEGYPYTIMWTVDTHDWAEEIGGKTVTVDYVVNRVLDNACPNAIVLMHIGGPKTVQALPRIISGLGDRGYSYTTVDKLLPPPGNHLTVHIVKRGETLYGIAQRFEVTVQQIIKANNL